ncbi:MAG: hypothetical protein HY951_05450 [Bacteroidia bacterium]|nr:hypothetical protein [Bacteroidia bacterium]
MKPPFLISILIIFNFYNAIGQTIEQNNANTEVKETISVIIDDNSSKISPNKSNNSNTQNNTITLREKYLTLEELLEIDLNKIEIDVLTRNTLNEILLERKQTLNKGLSIEDIDKKISNYLIKLKIKA